MANKEIDDLESKLCHLNINLHVMNTDNDKSNNKIDDQFDVYCKLTKNTLE